ncbi:endonuclease/exonuclease/phosphatase family protein [Nocardia salmonicida]|uniref:endonuclease/exonuclease/phosphatase family protein n=1 Tax=Nocardia salmonicida TaxID=53431 RepID=UPI0007A3DA15|nr:endonuclease/exonuclease/phosphatase family protein [Nocardia salmonicida]MBC7299502.1 endonuclease/exonuclease/phosphatase family protein [Nocardia sp.]
MTETRDRFTLITVNAWDLYAATGESSEARYRALEEWLARQDADAVGISEIIADGEGREAKAAGAEAGLRRLAKATGMECEIAGEPIVATGGIVHHTGLLYRSCPEIRPRPGSIHRLEREMAGMWHCAVSAIFEFNGRPLRVMSLQLSPFDPAWRAADALQILRTVNKGDVPAVIGGDFNCVSLTDPDPYAGVEWHPDHVYQLDIDGQLDRHAAIRLERQGRMRDCAELAGVELEATTGHAAVDHHPPRRIDRWLATHQLPAAVVAGYRVTPLGDLLHADDYLTDHRPVTLEINANAIPL